jgi:hypothetical protein
MTDSSKFDGDRLEVVLEVVASKVRFFDTARRIRRILGCSSDFKMLGSLSPHIFLCEYRRKSWKQMNARNNNAVGKGSASL